MRREKPGIASSMCRTCDNVRHMSKMIQIRNVPDEIHTVLKVRAAQKGVSLSDYLLKELEMIAEKPTLHELLERLRQQEPVKLSESPADIIRQDRDSH